MSFTTDNNRRNSLFLQKIEIDMEQLNVFDCSNVLIASFFTDDRGCAHENREHTLIYLCSGELEIEERGKKTILHPGECAFHAARQPHVVTETRRRGASLPLRRVEIHETVSAGVLPDTRQKRDSYGIEA